MQGTKVRDRSGAGDGNRVSVGAVGVAVGPGVGEEGWDAGDPGPGDVLGRCDRALEGAVLLDVAGQEAQHGHRGQEGEVGAELADLLEAAFRCLCAGFS